MRVQEFRHEDLIQRFLAPVPRDLRERLLAIDEEARHAPDPAVYLDEKYQELAVPEAVDAAFGELRTDTEAVLNGREASALTLGASITQPLPGVAAPHPLRRRLSRRGDHLAPCEGAL